MPTTFSTSASVAVLPGATPEAPQPTDIAMFGMTRTTLAWGKAASTVSVPMPAMMVTTSVPGR